MIGATQESSRTRGTSEGKNEKSVKSNLSKNMTNKSKKRNPYIANSTNRNPKIVTSNQGDFKRNAKQKKLLNKMPDLGKAKENPQYEKNKIPRSAMKSADIRNRCQTANLKDKYDEEKRKSEITNKLLRSKSVKKVQVNDGPTDILENIAENVDDLSISNTLNKCEKIASSANSVTSVIPDNILQEEYWNNVMRMADEELKKSTDLVEMMRNWSELSFDACTDQILAKLKVRAQQDLNLDPENLESILNRNREIHSSDLISRSKYTLLDPSDDLAGKSTLLMSDQFQEENELHVSEDGDAEIAYSLNQTLSESILNVNSSNTIDLTSFLVHRPLNEEFKDAMSSGSELLLTSMSEMGCPDDEDKGEIDAKSADNKESGDHASGALSESDFIMRERKCKANEIEIFDTEGDDEEEMVQDNYHAEHLTSGDCESDGSELDEDKLFLTSSVSKFDKDGPIDVYTIDKSPLSEVGVEDTVDSLKKDNYVDIKAEEDSDVALAPCIHQSNNDRKSHEDCQNDGCENSKLDFEDEDIRIDLETNDQHYVLETEEHEKKSDILCKCSVEIFQNKRSEDDVHSRDLNADISAHMIISAKTSSPMFTETDEIDEDSKVFASFNDSNETEFKEEVAGPTESVTCNLFMENTQIKNSDLAFMIEESFDSNEEGCEDGLQENSEEEHSDIEDSFQVHEEPVLEVDVINVDECINDEFVHMLIQDDHDMRINRIETKPAVDEQVELPESGRGEENSNNLDSHLEEILGDDIVNGDPVAKIYKIFGNGAEVIRNSSLPSLLGVTAAMFIAAVSVLYFWYSASGIEFS